MRLFYIFYNQERWDNWVNSLRESNFEPSDGGDEMPEGYRTLYNFGLDITLEVLKIIRLYQNQRFSKEEALEKLIPVEQIVMCYAPLGQLGEMIESLQLSMLVLFAGCKQFLGFTGGVAGRILCDEFFKRLLCRCRLLERILAFRDIEHRVGCFRGVR